MKIKTYKLLEDCIESGVSLGLSKAYKHVDNPSKESLNDHIIREIMFEISEWFDFGENDEN